MNHTYLVASLPMLFFGDPPPFSCAEFRRRCEGMISAAELAMVDALLDGRPAGGGRFADGWQAREVQVRNAVARARAAEAGIDARGFLHDHPGFDMSVAQAVADAYAKPNPLEREMELDRCRWRVADDLGRASPFGLDGLLAFAVKLRIAERWAGLSEEAGRRKVDEFVEAGAAGDAKSK